MFNCIQLTLRWDPSSFGLLSSSSVQRATLLNLKKFTQTFNIAYGIIAGKLYFCFYKFFFANPSANFWMQVSVS